VCAFVHANEIIGSAWALLWHRTNDSSHSLHTLPLRHLTYHSHCHCTTSPTTATATAPSTMATATAPPHLTYHSHCHCAIYYGHCHYATSPTTAIATAPPHLPQPLPVRHLSCHGLAVLQRVTHVHNLDADGWVEGRFAHVNGCRCRCLEEERGRHICAKEEIGRQMYAE
jgi:hypothetical protein